MAVIRREGQPIHLLEFLDLEKGLLSEGQLALVDMQKDSLEKVADREVLQLGYSLKNLERSLFYPDSRLNSLNDCEAIGTHVPWYLGTTALTSTPNTFKRPSRALPQHTPFAHRPGVNQQERTNHENYGAEYQCPHSSHDFESIGKGITVNVRENHADQ